MLIGYSIVNSIFGLGGNDTITAVVHGDTIDGGADNDTLTGAPGGSNTVTTFIGGTGNDRMVGGFAASTYVINRGDGIDTILDDHTGYGVANKLVFGANIVAADLEFSRTGDDLIIMIKDALNTAATDQVTIEKWFTPRGGFQLDQLTFVTELC